MKVRSAVAGILCISCGLLPATAQQAIVDTQKPTGFVVIRPYKPAPIPPVRTTNSLRLRDLMRGGKIYLTAQDAVALALENNVDLAIDRYAPLSAVWSVERSEAGGALPGLPNFQTQSTTVAAGQGAQGAQASAGVSTSFGGGNFGNNSSSQIQQIGAITPVLDPVVQHSQVYSHRSTPQANTRLTQPTNYIQSTHNYSDSISQGLITGGTVTLGYNESYLDENVPSDYLNPTTSPVLSLQFQHSLLAGFGRALNSRSINVAKNTVREDDLTFRSQVMSIVANVLNLYYGLVADRQDVRAKQSAFDVAQRFFQDNKKQVQIGTMAPLDVTTAEAQVASTQQDLVVSQTTLAEQEVSLKNVLSLNGLADPLIADADIVPLDPIYVPEKESLPSMTEMVATAIKNRPDLAATKINIENLDLNALNTQNSVLPNLQVNAITSQQGLSGTPQAVLVRSDTGQNSGGANAPVPNRRPCPAGTKPPNSLCDYPDAYFIGGITNSLGQMIRRNFPTETVGGGMFLNFRNRAAQADQRIDQLTNRQVALQARRDVNQASVDVSNQSVGLQQARARYQSALHNRVLQEQLLEAEQKKFKLGASTTFLVVQQQRDLATAQSAETTALGTYSTAKVALNQTLGITLEANQVTLSEAQSGHVTRRSTLPEKLPEAP